MTVSVLEKPSVMGYDVQRVREDFPILHRPVHGKRLVYLDNANTTQKPQAVLDAIHTYYATQNANIHRASHWLGEQATQAYEGARRTVATFLHARQPEEIVFTRNATESINLVAQTFGRANIGPGDEVLVSAMEHHANIVPWQMICAEKGAMLKVIPITDSGELRMDEYARLLSAKTKIVGIVHMSNALGTVNPIKSMIDMAHAQGIPVLVDAAQSAYHMPLDVQELDCDFLVFSGHKLYGPTGIGILYGKHALLDVMPPYQGGGDMIATVTFEKVTYAEAPHKFEAGTPHIEGAVGLGAAIDYLTHLGMDNIGAYEGELMAYGTEALTQIDGLRMIGAAPHKASVYSFVLDWAHAQDVGAVLDMHAIAVRVGQHCAHPVMQRFGVTSTVRASLGLYNMREEIDALVQGLATARRMLA